MSGGCVSALMCGERFKYIQMYCWIEYQKVSLKNIRQIKLSNSNVDILEVRSFLWKDVYTHMDFYTN